MKKLFCFGNMKGGVGKSTITALTANLLSMEGKEVCIIDCDDTQNTLSDIRYHDKLNHGIDEETNDLYYITNISSVDTAPILRSILLPDYDFVLIDLPGNIKQEGVMECYLEQDIIFLLFDITKNDILSTIKFYNHLLEKGFKGEIYGIPTKVNTLVKEWRYFIGDKTGDYIHFSDLPFKLFKSFIKYDQITYNRSFNTVKQNFANAKGEIKGIEFFDELKTYIY
jgi:chromosome partitioning protein